MESLAAGETATMMEGLRAQVDSFLVESLENPRHRLTVLRMEFDIQRFMQNPHQYQFEFQHLPTSYLRCAAHRVAQHYGLQTMALDNSAGGLGSKVIARKTPDSKFPAICLSQVPVKQTEKEMSEQLKIVIRPRSVKSFPIDDAQLGLGKDTRSVEERMEEYDRARARIFSGPSGSEVDVSPSTDSDRRSMSSSRDEQDYTLDELEKALSKDNASRVAIFRDREKDLSDPDYDRSYQKYVRGLTPCQNFGLQPCNIPQPPFLQHEPDISSFNHLPRNQNSLNYNLSNSAVNPYCAYGYNQNVRNALSMQWPSPAMMYAYSYEHFRQAQFQAPLYQQPLSFDHLRNC